MEFTIEKICDNFWAIDQQGVRAFLFAGNENALLVDTCFRGDIKSVCETLTDQPITLITTHADPDHMGCDHQFHVHYIHEAELPLYRERSQQRIVTVREGDVFRVGQYNLEVIWIPGHTPGSIALLDREHRFLISGDTVQAGCIYMHGQGRDLPAFRDTIAKLEQLRADAGFDTIYASHGPVCVPADILEDHRMLAQSILSAEAVHVAPAPEWFPDTVKTYGWGRVKMYF